MPLPYQLVVKSEILSKWWHLLLWSKHHNTFTASQLDHKRLTTLCKQWWKWRKKCSRQHKIGHRRTKYIVPPVRDIDRYTVIHIRYKTVISGKLQQSAILWSRRCGISQILQYLWLKNMKTPPPPPTTTTIMMMMTTIMTTAAMMLIMIRSKSINQPTVTLRNVDVRKTGKKSFN